MLDLSSARDIAERHVDTLRFRWGQDILLDDRYTIEHPSCFVFVYNTREFVEGGDEEAMLIGAGPLLVDRETGTLHPYSSARSVEDCIRQFEESRRG